MIDNPEARRFPSPWIAEETDACFIIRDHSGYALAYVYFEDEPARRQAAGVQGYQAGLQTQVYSQPKKE
jgi:hypothetical protein